VSKESLPLYLTKQGNLWSKPQDQFAIKNLLLCCAIGYITKVNDDLTVRGFNSSKNSVGYVMLTHIVAIALGVHRIPFYQDRISVNMTHEKGVKQLLRYFGDQDVNDAINEFNQLYEHVQVKLKDKKLQSVRVMRHIAGDQANEIVLLLLLSQKLGYDYIHVSMDMMNSFTCNSGDYAHRGAEGDGVTLSLDISASDVLYCSQLVRCDNKNLSDPVESYEWVVINRDLCGKMKIPLSSIQCSQSILSRVRLPQKADFKELYDRLSIGKMNYLLNNDYLKYSYLMSRDCVEKSEKEGISLSGLILSFFRR
jgi:hypothetical protein